jgi:hypothetical protein
MKCCICFSKIESQNAPILTIGKLGNPRCLCPSCERLFDSATLGKTYDEVTEACREIGDTMTRCNADDETVFNEVNSIIAGAMERAESIKDGTYDFSLDEEFIESTNAEQIQEELPEELQESAEDIALDNRDARIGKIIDTITSWIAGLALVGAVAFFLLKFVFHVF